MSSETRIAMLEREVAALRARVERLERATSWDALARKIEEAVALNPMRTFGPIDTTPPGWRGGVRP